MIFLLYLLLLILVTKFYGSIVHEQPPYFIPNFPLILEVSFSEQEEIKLVQIVYRFPEQPEFSISTMSCQWNNCKTVIPTHKAFYIEYYIQVEFYSHQIIRSKSVKIYRVPIPAWQNIPQFGILNLFGNKQELRGFLTDEVLILPPEQTNQVLEKEPHNKVKNKDKSKSFLEKMTGIFKSECEEPEEIDESDEDDISEFEYKEIFTP